MSAFPHTRKIPVWLPAVLVAAATWAVAMLLFNRTSWHDWSQPNWLEGDPVEVYARVKIAAEQPWDSLISFTHIDRLGAPGRADWSAYPVPDKLVFVLSGLLARLTGLIAAVQLVAIAFLSLNAVSFYLTARWLRWRWEWAGALALVFAFCSYNVRWGITLSLSQSFTLPPLVLLCAFATRRNAGTGAIHRGWHVLAAVLGLWLGLGNPYLAYFAGVVGGGALALALLRRSPWSRLAPLAIFLGVVTLVFFATNAGYAWQHWHPQGDAALVRNMDDFAVYALRPVDWLVPPADHRLGFMARLGHAYLASRHNTGEFFYNYLGVLGLIGGLGLMAACLQSLRRKRLPALDVPLGLAWITVFGIAGGINTWLGAAGVDLFRASTRIGVFAVIWLLLFLGGRLHRATRRLARPVSIALAGVLAALACWEETPSLSSRDSREKNEARWKQYQQLTVDLEQSLPAGAAIFQLPAVPFPEAGRTGAMTDYEHFLPYLTSHSLRFSYGYLRTAPFARWARYYSGQPARKLVTVLELTGFAGLWIDERAYVDHAAELVGSLRSLGLAEIAVPAGIPVHVFRLSPTATPIAPDASDPRLQDAWDDRPASTGQPTLLALNGWYDLEKENARHWRWARQQARTGIWWDGEPTRATLVFRPDGQTGTRVTLRLDGREIWRSPILAGNTAPQQTVIALKPGLNTLDWELEGRTFRPGGNDPRRLGFMIENLAVSVP